MISDVFVFYTGVGLSVTFLSVAAYFLFFLCVCVFE